MALERYAGPGCLVEFMQGNQAQVAWVLEESSGRLRLYTLTKREEKLPVSRVLPWMGPRYEGARDRSEMLELMTQHQARRETAAAAVDALELWELAQGEVREESAEWFAGLVAEEPDVDAVAAMGRALLRCKTHFKFHPPKFEVYPAAVVDRRLAEQAQAEEREKVVVAGQAFFKELWHGWCSGERGRAVALAAKLDPGAADKLAEMLRRLIADPNDQEVGPLWALLRKGLPDHPFQPLLLAEQWGIVPPHYNYLLDQADYTAGDGWWTPYADEIAALGERLDALAGEPEPIPFVSVDSPTTRDIDDAFYAEPLPDGGSRLVLALADPALAWTFGGPLDLAVAHRASSLYLPEGVSHMLPEVLGTGRVSLLAGEVRPALVMEWTFADEDGEPRSFAMRKSWVRLAENTTYAAVEERLAGPDAADCLERGYRLAVALRRRRLENGAVVIERPEPDIRLTTGPDDVQVDIGMSPSYPKAQLLVSECMILGNAAAGQYAVDHGAAMLFRTQDAVLPPEIRGVHDDPPSIQRAVRELPPTLTEPDPRPHASLAVPAYAPITSPLRRYADLVNLAQVDSLLRTGSPRWTRAEFSAKLPELSARIEAVGRVQRFRPRYWKLLYLKRLCRERTFEGVVVDFNGGFVSLSLPDVQIYVRATRDTLGDSVYVGQRFAVKLGKIDPLNNELRVFGAEEIPTRLPESTEALFMDADPS